MEWEIAVREIDKDYALNKLDKLTFPRLSGKRNVGDTLMAVAVITGNKMIGLSILEKTSTSEFNILTLFVVPEWRRRGVGNSIFTTIDNFLKINKARATINFQSNYKSEKDLRSLLTKYAWSLPRDVMLLSRLSVENLCDASWYKLQKLPKGYSVVTWDKLNEEDVYKLQKINTRVPDLLSPFQQPDKRIPDLSLILFRNEIPVGWIISLYQSEEVVERSCFYIVPEERKPFLAPAFIVQLIKKQLHTSFKTSIIQIIVKDTVSLEFYKRFTRPFVSEETIVYQSSKGYDQD